MIPASKNGMTLMEVLIAITLTGIILVIVLWALRISVNAWEKGESGIEPQQRIQIGFDLMKRQITSMVRGGGSRRSATVGFTGNERTVRFESAYPMMPQNGPGNCVVEYRVTSGDGDRESLLFYEARYDGGGSKELGKFEENAHQHPIFKDMAEIRFSYLVVDPDDERQSRWVDEWERETAGRMHPAAVRCQLNADDHTPPVRMVAHIPVNPRE